MIELSQTDPVSSEIYQLIEIFPLIVIYSLIAQT